MNDGYQVFVGHIVSIRDAGDGTTTVLTTAGKEYVFPGTISNFYSILNQIF
jgi:hypothetical protein